jgi:hypothetical protein
MALRMASMCGYVIQGEDDDEFMAPDHATSHIEHWQPPEPRTRAVRQALAARPARSRRRRRRASATSGLPERPGDVTRTGARRGVGARGPDRRTGRTPRPTA